MNTCLIAYPALAALAMGNAMASAGGDRPRSPADGLAVHRTPHFEVRHSLTTQAATEVGAVLEHLRARYLRAVERSGLAVRPPTEILRWCCLDRPEDFRMLAAEDSDLPADQHAFYSPRTDVVSVLLPDQQDHMTDTLDLRRISHEAAHQLSFNTGLQTAGVMYPFWVSEGLATVLETATHDDDDLFANDNPARREQLAAARAGRRLLPLDTFLVLTAMPEGVARADIYAQAWGAFRFLLNRDPSALRRYLGLLAARPPGRRPQMALTRELSSSFGDLRELEVEWQRFLSDMRQPQ